MDADAISLYIFDIDRIRPGDILLTTVKLALGTPATWIPGAIRHFTKSQFSHAALYIGDGTFIEAIGTGVCRLAIMATGVQTRSHVRLLRLSESKISGAQAKAARAAKIGEKYLLRGYSRKGAGGVKIPMLRSPKRAELFCSQLVALAYEKAGQRLVPNKKSNVVGPGDLDQSDVLEDVTDSAIVKLQTDSPPEYFLDNHTRFERPHHWEVTTKLEILSSKDVQKALAGFREHPASFWELECVLANRRARTLDASIHRALEARHFAESYLEKTKRLIPFDERDMSLTSPDEANATQMEAAVLLNYRDQTRQIVEQLQLDVRHREKEHAVYREWESKTRLETFAYLGRLQSKLLKLSKNALEAKEKELAALTEEGQSRHLIS